MAKAIGQIAVNLTANSAAFSRDLDKARNNVRSSSARMNKSLSSLERSFGKVQRSSSKMLRGLTSWKTVVGTLAGTGGLGILIKNSLDTADAIAKAADVIGIHTGALQEYQHAARLSGVDTELLNKSFSAFTKRVGEARQNTGPLVTYLKKFDTQLLANIQSAGSMEDALELVFNRMGSLASAADRAGLANAAFSRSGLKLANMVKNGALGLKLMRQEAHELGLVLSDLGLRKAEEANDQLEKLTRTVKATFTQAVIENVDTLIASMENLTRVAVKAATAFSKFSKWMFDREVGVEMYDTIAQTAVEANKKMLASLEKQLKMEARLGSVHSEQYAHLQRRIKLQKETIAMGEKEIILAEKMDAHVKAFGSRPQGSSQPDAPGAPGAPALAAPKERTDWMTKFKYSTSESYRLAVADSKGTFEEMKTHVADYTDYTVEAYKTIDSRISHSFSSAADAMADFATTGKLNFKEFTNSLISDLIRMQTRMSLMDMFSNIMGVLGSTSMYEPAGGIMAIGGIGTKKFHSGGHIGEPITGIGLRTGQSYEFNANETVIPDRKLGGASGANVVININNQSGVELNAESQTIRQDPEKIVADIIVKRKMTNRGFRDALRG